MLSDEEVKCFKSHRQKRSSVLSSFVLLTGRRPDTNVLCARVCSPHAEEDAVETIFALGREQVEFRKTRQRHLKEIQ